MFDWPIFWVLLLDSSQSFQQNQKQHKISAKQRAKHTCERRLIQIRFQFLFVGRVLARILWWIMINYSDWAVIHPSRSAVYTPRNEVFGSRRMSFKILSWIESEREWMKERKNLTFAATHAEQAFQDLVHLFSWRNQQRTDTNGNGDEDLALAY